MKPKENTIEKIDKIYEEISCYESPSLQISLALSLRQRCHSMNIHKARVVYFKRIKLTLTRLLELLKQERLNPGLEFSQEYDLIERELRALLDASNG